MILVKKDTIFKRELNMFYSVKMFLKIKIGDIQVFLIKLSWKSENLISHRKVREMPEINFNFCENIKLVKLYWLHF